MLTVLALLPFIFLFAFIIYNMIEEKEFRYDVLKFSIVLGTAAYFCWAVAYLLRG